MTTDQLVVEIIDLKQAKARADVEHRQFWKTIGSIQDDVKATKQLTEEVHIMASNISSMQKTLESTSKKVEELGNKEFIEYKETKKNIKDKIIGGIIGALITALTGGIGYLISMVVSQPH